MTRRVVILVVLVAISGLLVFGGVHRTQSVLASEGRAVGTAQVQGSGAGGGAGSGRGMGLGNGSGRGAHGSGSGTGTGEGAAGTEAGGH
jgi:eukaryotic-like serine/threonine-protein kinase